MRGREFLARLRDEVLVGDGALGTLISERGPGLGSSYERLNLTHPEFIKELHAAYLAAGAQVLETNTFGANRTKLAPFDQADDAATVNRAGNPKPSVSGKSVGRAGISRITSSGSDLPRSTCTHFSASAVGEIAL